MMSFAGRDVRPHPEERACGKSFANAKARTRVSKDGDERLGSPSCFETHRGALGLWKHLRSRPAAMLLSMRARERRAFWRNEPNVVLAKRSQGSFGHLSSPRRRGPMITAGGYGSRLSLRSAGTTIAWPERSTNLRMYEIATGAISIVSD